MDIKYTDEQLPAINSLARLVRLIAFAGTGKTTTLVGYSNARPDKRILYICYNKSVELEAKRKFPPHVTCKTSHGLAYQAVGAKYQHKLTDNLRLTDVGRAIGSQNWDMVRAVLDTLNGFLCSADRKVLLSHVPAERMENERMRQAAARIVDTAQRLWDRMSDPNDSEVETTHDGYLKAWSLSRPDLTRRFDIILVDEAQDANPLLAGLVADQAAHGMGVVVCGDGHQMLYRFRGAVDALEADWLREAETHYLTKSFRFGSAVATVANMILHFKGETLPLQGLGQNTRVGKKLPAGIEHRTVLCRTVVGVIEVALTAQANKEKIYWVGGIDAYKLQDIEDVHSLANNRKDLIKNRKLLKEFQDYAHYQYVAAESKDGEMQRTMKLVDDYRSCLPQLFAKLRASAVRDELQASITVSTAHKSKGLEWDYVVLYEDFQFEPFSVENTYERFVDEMNLLYVAATRAMKMLAINGVVLEIMQEYVDRRDGRKPDRKLIFKDAA